MQTRFASALDSIRAGTSDVALVAGAECQTTVSARVGGDYLARASHYCANGNRRLHISALSPAASRPARRVGLHTC